MTKVIRSIDYQDKVSPDFVGIEPWIAYLKFLKIVPILINDKKGGIPMVWIFGFVILLIVLFLFGSILGAAGSAVSSGRSPGAGRLLAVLVFGGIGYAAMTYLSDSTGWAIFGAIVGGLTAVFLQQDSPTT